MTLGRQQAALLLDLLHRKVTFEKSEREVLAAFPYRWSARSVLPTQVRDCCRVPSFLALREFVGLGPSGIG